MSRPDGFEEYAAARWPDLVRVALLLGAPEPVAVDVATEALARLRGAWRGLLATGDPDIELRALVVSTWAARSRRPSWVPEESADLPPDLAGLAALDPDERADVVLAILDRTQEATDARGAAARELRVTAPVPGSADLRAATHRRRVRVARRAVVPALALAVVLAAGGGLVALLDDDPPPPRGLPRALSRVEVGEGPSSFVTWYAAGLLHLGASTVAVDPVRAVVDVLGAAVYVDGAGDVVRVGPDGRRLLLGRTDDPGSVVASADGALVGWVDVTRASEPTLVVAASADGVRRATYRLGGRAATRPVGLREDRMYVVDADRTRVWRFDGAGMGDPDRPDLDRLEQVTGQLAVLGSASPSGRTRLAFLDPQDRTPPETTWVTLPGEQVRLARDGSLVASRSSTGEVVLVAQGAGGLQPSGLGADEVALDVSVGPDRQVAYVVAPPGGRATSRDVARSAYDGPLTLRTCTVSLSPRATQCRSVVDLTGDELPVLAR